MQKKRLKIRLFTLFLSFSISSSFLSMATPSTAVYGTPEEDEEKFVFTESVSDSEDPNGLGEKNTSQHSRTISTSSRLISKTFLT